MINIIRGSTKKPISSNQLASLFEEHFSSLQGELYIGYPIIAAPEGAFPIDALLISKEKGLIIFSLIEGREINANYADIQDENANRLETKLRSYSTIMNRRKLLAEPNVITFAPAVNFISSEQKEDGYPLCNEDDIISEITKCTWENSELFENVLSIIQSISTIRKGKRTRNIKNPDSRGAKLKFLEDSISNLDNIQGKAVIETVDGVQRIRGLAGSGKTIILALKAAYLHTQHPDWHIAITFNTRALKEQFRRLINTFVIEQSGEEPIWSNLSILNAWGAPGEANRSGVYYQFAIAHGIEYIDFQTAKRKYPYEEVFKRVCQESLNLMTEEKHLFDAILIDEAQDFDASFFQMCYSMLPNPKRLVYAYDELQSLTDTNLLPPEELFGNEASGNPRVKFSPPEIGQPQQDIILEKCYRNSRPVLATAHALGFGIYRTPDVKTQTGLIQMFDQNQLWIDVGYAVIDGHLEDDQQVTLERTNESSPKFLEDHSEIDDLIRFIKFANKEEQAAWLAEEIKKNIVEDELNADDIIVINPDPISTRKEVGLPRKKLYEESIKSHLVGVDSAPDTFFDPHNQSVAFTGIFRAKGNEAGMVYIMNTDHCASSFGNLARVRNQLFTAVTRSKAWVRVLGVGDKMDILIQEFNDIKKQDFKLKFHYPSESMRRTMNIINRDKTEAEKSAEINACKQLEGVVGDIKSGKVLIEDLPDELVDGLRSILNKSSSYE